jgi:hypothetical protein
MDGTKTLSHLSQLWRDAHLPELMLFRWSATWKWLPISWVWDPQEHGSSHRFSVEEGASMREFIINNYLISGTFNHRGAFCRCRTGRDHASIAIVMLGNRWSYSEIDSQGELWEFDRAMGKDKRGDSRPNCDRFHFISFCSSLLSFPFLSFDSLSFHHHFLFFLPHFFIWFDLIWSDLIWSDLFCFFSDFSSCSISCHLTLFVLHVIFIHLIGFPTLTFWKMDEKLWFDILIKWLSLQLGFLTSWDDHNSSDNGVGKEKRQPNSDAERGIGWPWLSHSVWRALKNTNESLEINKLSPHLRKVPAWIKVVGDYRRFDVRGFVSVGWKWKWQIRDTHSQSSPSRRQFVSNYTEHRNFC